MKRGEKKRCKIHHQQFDYFFDFYHDTNLTASDFNLADIVYYRIFPNTATSLFPMNKLQCVLFFKMCLIRSVVSSLPVFFCLTMNSLVNYLLYGVLPRRLSARDLHCKIAIGQKKLSVVCMCVYVVCFMPCS